MFCEHLWKPSENLDVFDSNLFESLKYCIFSIRCRCTSIYLKLYIFMIRKLLTQCEKHGTILAAQHVAAATASWYPLLPTATLAFTAFLAFTARCRRRCRLRPAAGREPLNSSPPSLPVNHYAKIHPRLEHFLCKLRHFKRTVNVIADAERHLGPLQCLQCDKQHAGAGRRRRGASPWWQSSPRCAEAYCSWH